MFVVLAERGKGLNLMKLLLSVKYVPHLLMKGLIFSVKN